MTKIDKSQIEHIAKLSNLDLSEEEKSTFPDDLSRILNYVDQLSEINTDDVLPMANVTGQKNIAREDKIVNSGVSLSDIKLNVPAEQDGAIKVPGVFE